jgi:nicotinic acid mononucleotide adenylyltransferase
MSNKTTKSATLDVSDKDSVASSSKKKLKNAKTLTGSKADPIDTSPEEKTGLNEAKQLNVAFAFGRFNPPTIGHEKLVEKLLKVASGTKSVPMLYFSHSQDKSKNPLSYINKAKYLRKAFGKLVTPSNSRNVIQILQELEKKGFRQVTMLAGSDRVNEFKALLNKYNGKEYNFDKISIVSAGERDPDSDDVSGMSASKMRAAVKADDFTSFKKGLPHKLQRSKGDSEKLYKAIRQGMGLSMNESRGWEKIVKQLPDVQRKSDEAKKVLKKIKDEKETQVDEMSKPSVKSMDAMIRKRRKAASKQSKPMPYSKKEKEEIFRGIRYPVNENQKKKIAEGLKKLVKEGDAWDKAIAAADQHARDWGPGGKKREALNKKRAEDPKMQAYAKRRADSQARYKKISEKLDKDASTDMHTNLVGEAKYAVDIEGMPRFYMDSDSPAKVKMALRQMLKKPSAVKSVTRTYDTNIKADLRQRLKDASTGMHTNLVRESDDVHARYMRIHGKKASGHGRWAFTTSRHGQSQPGQTFIHTGDFSSAHRAAKKHFGKPVYVMEKLDKDASMGEYIDDFKDSNAPQFKGKSMKKRRQMAIAAKLSAEGYVSHAQRKAVWASRNDEKKKKMRKESTDAYGKTLQKIADNKKKSNISKSDKDKLGKLAALMRREEAELYEMKNVPTHKLKALVARGDSDSKGMSPAFGMQIKAARRELARRKNKVNEGIILNKGFKEEVEINEVLTIQQRQKRKVLARRLKSKLARGRMIAKKKMAPPAKLKTRSQRKARDLIRKRFSAGKNYNNLSPAEKIMLDKRIESKQKLIAKIAKRLLPKVRKAEAERLKSYRQNLKKENYEFTERDLKNIARKAEIHNIDEAVLFEVYNDGIDLYDESVADKLNPKQFAFNRVNSYLAKGKSYYEYHDE